MFLLCIVSHIMYYNFYFLCSGGAIRCTVKLKKVQPRFKLFFLYLFLNKWIKLRNYCHRHMPPQNRIIKNYRIARWLSPNSQQLTCNNKTQISIILYTVIHQENAETAKIINSRNTSRILFIASFNWIPQCIVLLASQSSLY